MSTVQYHVKTNIEHWSQGDKITAWLIESTVGMYYEVQVITSTGNTVLACYFEDESDASLYALMWG